MQTRKLVEQSLKKTTTLVVLDGLDESAGCSTRILDEAKCGRHLRLVTSRPYGIESERKAADLEVLHRGVSYDQMEDFVHS